MQLSISMRLNTVIPGTKSNGNTGMCPVLCTSVLYEVRGVDTLLRDLNVCKKKRMKY